MKSYISKSVIIISTLITMILLYCSSGVYHKSSYIKVTFNVKQNKVIEYQIYYTTEKNQKFSEANSVKQQVLPGKKEVKITLPISQIEQFRFDFGINPGEVVLSDLTLSGKNKQSLDFKDFTFRRINSHTEKYGQLIISSNQIDPLMIYLKPIKIVASKGIDWYLFFILATVYFFIAYKIVKYLTKFKVEKNYSRIDIAFLSVFFALLFVPMLKISNAETSVQENRMLAKKPQFKDVLKKGDSYGANFEKWFNDRFLGRTQMLSTYRWLNHLITPYKGNKDVLVGKNGWLFYDNNIGTMGYANLIIFSDTQLANGLNYIKKFYSWSMKNNKKFYYMIIPDKNKVYGEHYRNINKINDDSKGLAQQFVSYIQAQSNIPVIYPKDVLINAKDKGLVYYKRDTHWSKFGAYQGYLLFMKQLKKDLNIEFFTVSDWSETKEVRADLSDLYHQPHIKDTVYLQPNISDLKCTVEPRYGFPRGFVRCEQNKGKYSIFVLRDSMFDNLLSYIAPNFKVVEAHWKQGITAEDLERIKAEFDIVLIENVERATSGVMGQTFINMEDL